MAAYQYSPLRDLKHFLGPNDTMDKRKLTIDGAWDIRLIRLKPNKALTTPIECELFHQRFSEARANYLALSYVWIDNTGIAADSQRPSEILVNGCAFPVTQNLQAALVRLRHRTEDRIFWIDQICINQADATEQSSQVGRMTFIYGFAQRVVIWLGEEAKESYRAMLLLAGLSRVSRLDNAVERLSTAVREFSALSRWRALNALLERPWWQRTWVVQEFAVAREVVVACGNRQCPWSDLMAAIYFMTNLKDQMPIRVGLVNTSVVTSLQQGRLRAGSRSVDGFGSRKSSSHLDTLLGALARYRPRQATEPKDKVYAILRLAQDYRDSLWDDQDPIEIDYSKTVEEVYLDTAGFFLASENPFAFLPHCRMTRNIPHLPTWVPDWSDTREFPHPFIGHATLHRGSFGRPTVKSGTLIVQGSEIGHISIVGDVCTEDDFASLTVSQTFVQWRSLAAESLGKQGDSQELVYPDEHFIRIIVADSNSGEQLGTIASADYASVYSQWSRATKDSNGPTAHTFTNDTLKVIEFLHVVKKACLKRRFFVSSRGVAGLAPEEAATGDTLVVFSGQSIPFALRKTSSGGHHLVGAW